MNAHTDKIDQKKISKSNETHVSTKNAKGLALQDNRAKSVLQKKTTNTVVQQMTETIQRVPKIYESLAEVEKILNKLAPGQWAYVGGYAAYLHAEQEGLPTVPFHDYDIVVPSSIRPMLRTAIYGEDNEDLPIAGGHEVSLISTMQLPETVKMGSARVASHTYVAQNYLKQLEMKFALKGGLKKNVLENKLDEKDLARMRRIDKMGQISLIKKKPVEWSIAQQLGDMYGWSFSVIWEKFANGSFAKQAQLREEARGQSTPSYIK